MGADEDIMRLRDDIADLYEQLRAAQQRLVRLEERSDNRDDKIEELKMTIEKLEGMISAGLAGLSRQLDALSKAPAEKIAGRWEEAIKSLILLVVGAIFAWLMRGKL